MMKRLCVILITSAFLPWALVSADIINVPGDYDTIQEGIEASSVWDNDTVLVQPGIYYENVSFQEHTTTLASLYLTTGDTSYISSTIIDGDFSGSVITVGLLAWPPTIVGFTIQNGYAYSGGGIYCEPHASLTISHNIIRNNSCEYNGGGLFCDGYNWGEINDNLFTENFAGYRGGGAYFIGSDVNMNNNLVYANTTDGDGGGIYAWGSFGGPIENNVITSNTASGDGGGIYLNDCGIIEIIRNVVADNTAAGNGGGVCCYNSRIIFFNNTTTRNFGGTGGGIYCDQFSFSQIVNSIFWDNLATVENDEIYQEGDDYIIRYSDIEGGFSGDGNINSDPLFVDPENGDFHIQEGSPCIDTGDPSSPHDPDLTIVDMGAYYYDQALPEIIDQNQLIATEGFWFDEAVVRWQQFFPTLDNITAFELHVMKAGIPGNVIVKISTD